MTLLEAALRYASIGLKVFPCWPGRKGPMVSGGYHAATTDPEQIKRWWSGTKSEANIGLPMEPNGLICIDLDPRNGGPSRTEFMELYGSYPDTTEQISGGDPPGRHLIFEAPRGIPQGVDVKNVKPGVDVKYRGYILAWPSIHPDSKRMYEWDGTDPLKYFAPLPDHFRWAITPAQSENKASLGELPDEILEGKPGRNKTLFQYACWMRAKRFSPQAIEATLKIENRDRCKPPLPEKDIETIARQAAKYAPGTTWEQQRAASEKCTQTPDILPDFPDTGGEEPRGLRPKVVDIASREKLTGAQQDKLTDVPEMPASAPDIPADTGAPATQADMEELTDAAKAAQSQIARLVNIARHGTFVRWDGTAYINVNGLTYDVAGQEFKHWLMRSYTRATSGRYVNPTSLANGIENIKAAVLEDGIRQEVFLRVAGLPRESWLDLGDHSGRAVQVDGEGWRVVDRAGVFFRRNSFTLPMVEPQRGGSIDELHELINVDDESFMLIVGFLVAALRGFGARPMLIIQGEAGSAKTSAARVLLEAFDSNTAGVQMKTDDVQDLAVASGNTYGLAWDNMSGMSKEMADALCQFVTGSSFTKRELYTNKGQIVIKAKRPVIINGIDSLATYDDIVSRALMITLNPISDRQRITDDELDEAVARVMPRVMGALLDAVACGIRRYKEPGVRPKSLPRMANFATLMEAASPALGWKPGQFMEVYRAAMVEASKSFLSGSPLASWLYRHVKSKPHNGIWETTAEGLLKALPGRLRPRSARVMGDQIRRIAKGLREGAGMDVEFRREPGSGRRLMRFHIVDAVLGVDLEASEPGQSMGERAPGGGCDDVDRKRDPVCDEVASQPGLLESTDTVRGFRL